MSLAATPARRELLHRALRLEYLTVGWNLVEGAIAVTAALAAGSVALLGFGIDSFVESVSGSVLVWRLRAETAGDRADETIERFERRAERLVGDFVLRVGGLHRLRRDHHAPQSGAPRRQPRRRRADRRSRSGSCCGWRGAKRRTAAELGSRALAADAEQTQACWYLSIVVLAGIGLNAAVRLVVGRPGGRARCERDPRPRGARGVERRGAR